MNRFSHRDRQNDNDDPYLRWTDKMISTGRSFAALGADTEQGIIKNTRMSPEQFAMFRQLLDGRSVNTVSVKASQYGLPLLILSADSDRTFGLIVHQFTEGKVLITASSEGKTLSRGGAAIALISAEGGKFPFHINENGMGVLLNAPVDRKYTIVVENTFSPSLLSEGDTQHNN